MNILNVTDNEKALIENIALNDYQDGASVDEKNAVWCDSLDCGPNKIPLTSIPGITSSLAKKSIVSTDGERIGLTSVGVILFRAIQREKEGR